MPNHSQIEDDYEKSEIQMNRNDFSIGFKNVGTGM